MRRAAAKPLFTFEEDGRVHTLDTVDELREFLALALDHLELVHSREWLEEQFEEFERERGRLHGAAGAAAARASGKKPGRPARWRRAVPWLTDEHILNTYDYYAEKGRADPVGDTVADYANQVPSDTGEPTRRQLRYAVEAALARRSA